MKVLNLELCALNFANFGLWLLAFGLGLSALLELLFLKLH